MRGHRDLKVFHSVQVGNAGISRVEGVSKRGALLTDRPNAALIPKRRVEHRRRVSEETLPEHVR